MAMIDCPQCRARISEKAVTCPQCGHPLKPLAEICPAAGRQRWGYQWKSTTTVMGWPLVHIAVGRDKETGRLLVAKGVIAIGQFAIGIIAIAQFGIGLLFGLGQFTSGAIAISQFAVGIYFGLGQFATGLTAIGQFAFGQYVLAWMGYGRYIWSNTLSDPEAVAHFENLWSFVKNLSGGI